MSALLFALSVGALCIKYRRGYLARWWNVSAAAVLGGSVAASMLVAGWRWPLVPMWLWLLALAMCLVRKAAPAPRWVRNVAFVCAVTLSFCALNVAQVMVRNLDLPPLTGPYAVAKQQWMIESERQDDSVNPYSKRAFLVNVYYPTLAKDDPNVMWRAPYLSPAAVAACDEYVLRFDDSALDRVRYFLSRQEIRLMRGRAVEGPGSALAPAAQPYPVILFSPGGGWSADMHTFFLEQLASHGYVVFGITHPGQTPLVEYPDGRHMRWGWSGHQQVEDAATRQKRRARYDELREQLRAASAKPTPEQLRELLSLQSIPLELPVREDDATDLLDRLAQLNAGEPRSQFAGRLDLSSIAVMGMSRGGSTASDVCVSDARCTVMVNMDGEERGRLARETISVESGVRASNSRVPALWLYRAGAWQTALIRRAVYDAYTGPAYRVGFDGADHGTFADYPFWPRSLQILVPSWLWQRGDTDIPPRILRYTLDFLDHYLKHEDMKLLGSAVTDAGVTVDRRNTAPERN